MENIRYHGKQPYQAAVIHGGPGGIGSANGLARGLASHIGVLEPLQGQYSIRALIDELHSQLGQYGSLTLIGHSWGAWLGVLYAVEYPELVKRLIIVGCGALDEKYLPIMNSRRLAHLTEVEKSEYLSLVEALKTTHSDNNEKLRRLGCLAEKADVYSPLTVEESPGIFDGEMYRQVWNEAAAMRRAGQLLANFGKLKIPLTVIHGEYDTTPPESIIEPLQTLDIAFDCYIIPCCGHTPWREKYASEEFFNFLSRKQLFL